MAGEQYQKDPARALDFKVRGNKFYTSGDYKTAEELYGQAIQHDQSNPQLYTNRSLASLKLQHFDLVIADCLSALDLAPEQGTSLKAYYGLAQAQISVGHPAEALQSALKAHEFCVKEIGVGGKGASSIGPITELVLRCKKEKWEMREKEREARKGGLLAELVGGLEREMESRIARGENSEIAKAQIGQKIEDLRKTFEDAGEAETRRKEVPDWCVDDISFAVMVDPVVTKTGQSYDRASIMEHLRRSATDPLTREPLTPADLRPNLALKQACAEFLEENGWAVDW
ncbi:U-box domain-containing protein [Phlyctema vagabunda]|uniref:E3 ubiquitin-protein ligase CHIP n=1 Tax=Phlyctema vagabunda TaxID=108571 RepID=A0ABR4P196_9HELO